MGQRPDAYDEFADKARTTVKKVKTGVQKVVKAVKKKIKKPSR